MDILSCTPRLLLHAKTALKAIVDQKLLGEAPVRVDHKTDRSALCSGLLFPLHEQIKVERGKTDLRKLHMATPDAVNCSARRFKSILDLRRHDPEAAGSARSQPTGLACALQGLDQVGEAMGLPAWT